MRLRLLRERAHLVVGQVLLHSGQPGQEQIAGARSQLLGEPLHVGALLVGAHHAAQRRGGVAGQHPRQSFAHHRVVERAQRLRGFPIADLAGGRIVRGEELVEERERIAHRSLRLPPDQAQRSVGHGHVLRLRDLPQPRHDLPQGHQLDVVPLHAREDGGGELLRVGGGEEELDVPRRLLQRLEQGVEGRAGEHVHFVNYVYFVAVARRQVAGRLAQRAHVVDAVVGSGVDLLHVHVDAGGDLGARRANAAGLRIGSRRQSLAVQRPGQDARAGGLSAAARSGEEEGVRQPPRLERIDQRADDVLLPRQIGESLGAVLSRQDKVRSRHLSP